MTEGEIRPRLVVLAGGNGSGKSTFYRLYLKPRGIPFINADEIAQEVWPGDPAKYSYQAMELAESARKEALQRGRSFCFETVFSHPSKIEFLRYSRKMGYEIHLYIFALQSPLLNLGRVEQRVSEGGHSVPTNKVLSRLPRTLANLKQSVPFADKITLLDNSRYESPFRIQARYRNGEWLEPNQPLVEWARDFIIDTQY